MKGVLEIASSIGKVTGLESGWVYLEPLDTISIDLLASLSLQLVAVCIIAAFFL
jgi:hypothetical protein